MNNIIAFVLILLLVYIIGASVMIVTAVGSVHYEMICYVVHGVYLAVAAIGIWFLVWKELSK